MSRSYRKNPIHGIAKCQSEKQDKRHANRAWRRIVKMRVACGDYDVLPAQKEISNIWDFGKDGKRWVNLDKLERRGLPRYKLMGK